MVNELLLLLLLLLFYIYPCLLVIRWWCYVKSRSPQVLKAIYPSSLRMTRAVLISVIFCSSVADGWPGRNWRFWSNPVLIVRKAPIITGTTFALTYKQPADLELQVF
jgi:hypothetical protein